MFAILAHIRPIDLGTDTRVDVYVASTPGPAYQGLGGFVWESAITRRPRAAIELFALDLAPGTRTATASFEISMAAIHEVDGSALHWLGAPVVIYRADSLQWPAPVEFSGIVTGAKPDINADTLALTCQVSTTLLEKPLLTLDFDDTVFDFDPERRTDPLPAGFGVCQNIEPLFFDTVRNIAMLDGYGNLISVEWTGEALATLGPVFADYANYAALAAAVDAAAIPAGRWATCLADGLIALGAPPVGVITCHATFGFGMTGALIRRMVMFHAGFTIDQVEDATFDALDAAVPFPVHFWTADQRQVKDMIEALAAGCNASPIVTFQNRLAVIRPFGGDVIASFVRNGFSEPAVTQWAANDPITPYWRVTARAARPVRVLALDEVNYVDDLIDRGLYDELQVYRNGNIVWLRDKSQWLYINETPGAGHTPPTGTAGDAYWILMAPAPGAEDLRYTDGTPIEDLQPEELGAQISRSINLSESSLSFTMDTAGDALPAQFPTTIHATLSEANYDVTLITDWSIVATAGIIATIDDTPLSPTRGEVEITDVTAAGTIQVNALRGGVAVSATISIATKGELADLSEVDTDVIVDNAVSQSNYAILELFGASVGTDDDNVWSDFEYSSVVLETSFTTPASAANTTGIFQVTLIGTRTGGDNDRVSMRVIRDDATVIDPAEHTYLLFESGGNTAYQLPFFDPSPLSGSHSYKVQTKNVVGHPAWQRGIIIPLRLSK